jgi:hypothetical protein
MAQMGPQKKNIISLSLSLTEIKDLQTLNFIFLKVKRVGGSQKSKLEISKTTQ